MDVSSQEDDTPLLNGEEIEREENDIKDRYNSVYILFYLMGMCTLLPWNFFISVNDYWDYKFRQDQELQKDFSSYLAIASNIPTAVIVILNAIFGHKIPLRYRITLNLIVIIVWFSVISSLALINTDPWQNQFMLLTLFLVVVVNVGMAFFQGAAYGIAGKFPQAYMGSMVAGSAMGGIFPSLVNIAAIAINKTSSSGSEIGFGCFVIATLFLLLTLLAFVRVRRSEFFRHHYGQENGTVNMSILKYKILMKRSWSYCFSVFIVFCTTLAVFPAVVVNVKSQSDNRIWREDYFTAVTCFLLFNVLDYIGRVVSSKFPGPGKKRCMILIVSVARIGFIPMFMLCNVSPQERTLPVYLNSDADYLFLMGLFAFSNGYLGGMCMIHGPKTSEEGDLQELTAMIMVAFLCLGTGCGSFLSYPILRNI